MRLLILGGTIFLGRHAAQIATERGHQITLLFRGLHNPDLFPRLDKRFADRADPAALDAALGEDTWDAVLDMCGYGPRVVGLSASRLKGRAGSYGFVSSVSVYAEPIAPGADETAPLVSPLADPADETITGETYGPLKAASEAAARDGFGGQAVVVRPGLIVGPHDPSDRFTYWPDRVARGGGVLAPGDGRTPVQIIDARDLAGWLLDLVEAGKTDGVYNTVGPNYRLTMQTLLETCQAVAGSPSRLVWANEAFLDTQGVAAWSDMPVWVPESSSPGFGSVSAARAIADGLHFRPVAETVRDTLAWSRTRPEGHKWRAGLTEEREAAVLGALGETPF